MSETKSKESIFARAKKNPTAVLALAFTIITAIPLLIPIGLPLPVEPSVKKFYDAIENLPQGELILVVLNPGTVIFDMAKDVMKHIISKKHKFVQFTAEAAGWAWADMVLRHVQPDLEAQGYVYGEDYAYLGFITGREVTFSGMYTDFHGVVKADLYGTPAKQVPILADIVDHTSFDLGMICLSAETFEMWSRQWPKGSFKRGAILITSFQFWPAALPFVGPGNVYEGWLSLRSEQAVYEIMTGIKGRVVRETDAATVANCFLAFEALFLNIYVHRHRILGRKKEVEE
jgi:hypothetical protein